MVVDGFVDVVVEVLVLVGRVDVVVMLSLMSLSFLLFVLM